VSVLLLLWSASSVFSALGRAINRAWDVYRDRPFHVRKLRDVTMAVGVGGLFLLSMGATSAFSILESWHLPFVTGSADLGSRLLGFGFSLGIFLVLYKFLPNTRTYWRYIWLGAVVAAVLFETAKTLFVFYLARFANYESVYGSVASVIILLVWIYISALILILGAEVSAEYGRMRQGVRRDGLLVDHPEDAGDDKRGRAERDGAGVE